jgi:hypothetical protein
LGASPPHTPSSHLRFPQQWCSSALSQHHHWVSQEGTSPAACKCYVRPVLATRHGEVNLSNCLGFRPRTKPHFLLWFQFCDSGKRVERAVRLSESNKHVGCGKWVGMLRRVRPSFTCLRRFCRTWPFPCRCVTTSHDDIPMIHSWRLRRRRMAVSGLRTTNRKLHNPQGISLRVCSTGR